jgi:hypothetical protein
LDCARLLKASLEIAHSLKKKRQRWHIRVGFETTRTNAHWRPGQQPQAQVVATVAIAVVVVVELVDTKPARVLK